MALVMTRPGMPIAQVEGFPEKAKRSVKGALHLRPRATITVTDDEYAHIKEKRPDLFKHMTLLEKKHATKKKAGAKPSKPGTKSSEKKATSNK